MPTNETRSLDEKFFVERRRDCLVLILQHLQTCGFSESAAHLRLEAGNILSHYEHADNIDLLHLLADYEEYYLLKYAIKPRYSRKITADPRGAINRNDGRDIDMTSSRHARKANSTHHNMIPQPENIQLLSKRHSKVLKRSFLNGRSIEPDVERITYRPNTEEHSDTKKKKQNTLNSISSDSLFQIEGCAWNECHQSDECMETIRSTKPLPTFGGDVELRSLALSIQREILDQSPQVSWDEIIQLDDAKKTLQEAIILPLKFPFLFQGLLEPWRGVLLYGPPGTGKTLLARAVASESSATFFNLSASSLVSKYRGESEKLIRVLFTLARHNAPSTIFIDEIDSIMGHRGSGQVCSSSLSKYDGGSNEHEGSRRMKTELLIEMDGLGKGGGHVFVLVATNTPWDIDPAFLRRLEKRILVPMPSKDARKMMIQYHLSKIAYCSLCEDDYDHIAILTEGFSGADVKLLCKEAAMRPVREILVELDNMNPKLVNSRHSNESLEQMSQKSLSRHPLSSLHLENSLAIIKHSVNRDLCQKYSAWSLEYGSN